MPDHRHAPPAQPPVRTPGGESRRALIRRALAAHGLDALVCSLPTNVVMLTGYWPVVGDAVAIATRDGRLHVLAPRDEEAFARVGWADEVQLFDAGSLDDLRTRIDVVTPLVKDALDGMGVESIGCESGRIHEPSSYVSMYFYGGRLHDMLAQTHAHTRECDALLERLRTVKTPEEVRMIRVACEIASRAFEVGRTAVEAGRIEPQVASRFREPLLTEGIGWKGTLRADGFTFCMSGPNAAAAYAAFGCNRTRVLQRGDLVMVHCNSYADGYWTDITRTYCLGPLGDRRARMVGAVLEAREAALSTIRAGVPASAVDHAARAVLQRHRLGDAFKHPTGHGVGFGSSDHLSRPMLHPHSTDVLEAGMVLNVEPAIYLQGWGGIRHCDVVAVEEDGASLLTPFQSSLADLVLP